MGLETTQFYISKAAKLLNMTNRLEKMFITPYRIIKTEVVIEEDDGRIGNYLGYRVQHNNALGPMKGGLRFHPEVDESEVTSLASLMTWKTSLLRIPFGGAKGGIICDPKQMSEDELERLTKRFTETIKEMIGPYVDIPAPDVNTNAQIMAWIMHQYSKHYGFTPGVVTGKPVYLHGSEGRSDATGLGVVYSIENILNVHKKVISDCSFIVQGFGNVGRCAALALHKLGGKVVGVSDVSGGLIDDAGLNVEELAKYVDENGVIEGFSQGNKISNEDLIMSSCDVLVPAALGDVIRKDNADQVQAKFIVEGANGPCTFEADEILEKKDIVVVPDILANAGGVTVSYFEWTQNIQQYHWKEEKVLKELRIYMDDAFERVISVSKSKNVSLRTAAFIIAMGRVAKAQLTAGL